MLAYGQTYEEFKRKQKEYAQKRYWKKRAEILRIRALNPEPETPPELLLLREKSRLKKLKICVANWRKNNPEKSKANRLVFVAVRNKSLKKVNCFCGESRVEAHHEDYSKPLEVIWLCKKHHVEADKIRREKEQKSY